MSAHVTKLEEIKIILVGNSGVGKTAIINRYYNNSFEIYTQSTISMNFVEKKIYINDKYYDINIWDTAGQEIYRSCNKLFIKNSNIVIFVYDITNKKTFVELDYWYKIIEDELGQSPYLALVGNKSDLYEEEEVKEEEGKELAKKWSAYFSLLSPKCDKKGIDNFFYSIVDEYLFCKNDSIDIRLNTVVLKKNDERKKNGNDGCCGGGKSKICEKNIKVLFIGGNKSGKKEIISKILGNRNNISYEYDQNINESIYSYETENKKMINVNILNINELCLESKKIVKLLEDSRIFFLVFDIDNKDTFNILNKWIEIIKDGSEGKKNL